MPHETIWKWLAGGLLTILVAFGGVAYGATQNGVSEGRVKEIVQTDSPYIQDRETIKTSLAVIQKTLNDVQKDVHTTSVTVQEQHDALLRLQAQLSGLLQPPTQGGTP